MKTMKKLSVATIVTISLAACQQETFEGRHDSNNYYASVETFVTGTKTALGDNRSVVWSSDDRIAIFEGKDVGQVYQVLDSYVGKSSGEFAEVEGLVTEGTGAAIDGTVAVYPFNEDIIVTSGDNGDYVIEGVTFPSEQKYNAGSFSEEAFPMVAVTSDKNLSFKNVGGLLKLSLTGSYSVSSITLTGNSGEPLSGPATVTLGLDGIPSVTMSDDASTSVTLVCDPAVKLDPGEATDFYISIPPTEFDGGFTVNITEREGGNAIKNTEKQNNVCRSQILVMPAFAPATHLFKENYYEDYDAYISDEGITMLSNKTEDGYEIFIGHYDETEDSWNDDQLMIIHTDSLSRISDLYIENELLRFSNYSDNAVDILHIVGEDYELYEHIETPTTRSVLFATKSEGADADQGSETIDDLIKVIAGTKASFELAVNLVKHKGKIQTVLASINYISTAIPGLGGVALSEIQIGLEKKILGRMPSFLEGELLLIEAGRALSEVLTQRLIGDWDLNNVYVDVYSAQNAAVNYTISGIMDNPSINLWGTINYRNITKKEPYTNISISVINQQHKVPITLSGPGYYIASVNLHGSGGFFKTVDIKFNVPDYPMCQTGSAYNITTTSAVVDCTFSNIPEDGQCQVLLSWDDGYKIVKAENREGEQEIILTDLEPNTTYSYCASIDYEGGPVNGETKEFTTRPQLPTIKIENIDVLYAVDQGETHVALGLGLDLACIKSEEFNEQSLNCTLLINERDEAWFSINSESNYIKLDSIYLYRNEWEYINKKYRNSLEIKIRKGKQVITPDIYKLEVILDPKPVNFDVLFGKIEIEDDGTRITYGLPFCWHCNNGAPNISYSDASTFPYTYIENHYPLDFLQVQSVFIYMKAWSIGRDNSISSIMQDQTICCYDGYYTSLRCVSASLICWDYGEDSRYSVASARFVVTLKDGSMFERTISLSPPGRQGVIEGLVYGQEAN